MKKKLIIGIAALLSITTACGSDGTAEESTPEKLTLLAYDSFTPSEGVFDAFTKETGITVEVVTGGDAGELVAKAVLTAGAPEGDELTDRKSTRLNSSHLTQSRMPSSA